MVNVWLVKRQGNKQYLGNPGDEFIAILRILVIATRQGTTILILPGLAIKLM